MTERSVSLLVAVITAGLLAVIFFMPDRYHAASTVGGGSLRDINAMPPSAVGEPGAAAPRNGTIGGTRATGRVAGIYLKVGQGVFLALDQAPETLRKSAERWVDVEFPDLLADGSAAARAFVGQSQSGIVPGDIVEIKFAHKSTHGAAYFFPVKETTRVTELVAKRDEMLARDFEQRIVARNARGLGEGSRLIGAGPGTQPSWLSQAGTAGSPATPLHKDKGVAEQTAASASK